MKWIAFKRVEIGTRFSYKGDNYRKASNHGAFRLKESGRGETHAQIKFAKNTQITPL